MSSDKKFHIILYDVLVSVCMCLCAHLYKFSIIKSERRSYFKLIYMNEWQCAVGVFDNRLKTHIYFNIIAMQSTCFTL